MLTQGKDDNEAGRKKDKQDTVNTIAREYNKVLLYVGIENHPLTYYSH